MSRAKRVRETPEYAAMVRRIIRAHGRRVGDADPEDLVELAELRDVIEEAIADAVGGLREGGCSWAQVARGLGTTRQAAQQRYRTTERLASGAPMPGQTDLWS